MIINSYNFENYSADALAYFAEAVTPPNSTFKGAIDWGIADFKATGNWTKLNFLFLSFTPDQTLSRSNIKTPSFKLTEAVSSGWTANEFWSGNGLRYLNLNWDPATNGGSTYTRDNGGFTIMPAVHGQLNEGVAFFGARQAGTRDNFITFSAGNVNCAINGDSGSMTSPKSAGLITLLRNNAVNFGIYRQGLLKNTVVRASTALSTNDWAALGWNDAGVIGAFTTNNKMALMAAHTGDLDVAAFKNTITGIIARLNGGYKMTTLTENISGINPMDSGLLAQLDASTMISVGGYDPLDGTQATNKVLTTPDGITWTATTSMPFTAAHCIGGVLADGWLHIVGSKQTGQAFHIKRNPSGGAWTTVNGDLGAVGQPCAGYTFLQWGGLFNGGVKIAATNDSGATVKVFNLDGTTWTIKGTFPVANVVSAGVSIVGTSMRVAGGGLVSGGLTTFLNDKIYESTDDCVSWNLIRTLPAKLLSCWPSYERFSDGTEVYITGRNTTTSIYEGGCFRWDGSDWPNMLITELSGRHAVATRVFNNAIYCLNGFLYNDCYKIEAV